MTAVEPIAGCNTPLSAMQGVLRQLEAEGARGYDAPLYECAVSLLQRAAELPGPVGERLVARAEVYARELSESFARDRARAHERVARVENARGPQPALTQLLARGEVTEAMRVARRVLARPIDAAPRQAAAELVRVGPGNHPPQRPKRAAQSLEYEDSVAEMVASLALARAVDVVPKDAGPYNPLRIASGLLDSLREVSPFFLTVQLNRLEELGSLLTLPDLPEKPPPAAPPPQKKKLPSRTKRT